MQKKEKGILIAEFFRNIIMLMSRTYIKPVRILSNVLFPAPEGPMIAVSSPDLNSPETPFSMVFFATGKKIRQKNKTNQ